MATIAQTEANRQNAQHSTGPTSEAGRATSSLNRLSHGFTGIFRLLKWENRAEYETMRHDFRDEHKPATHTERILVERLAQHQWLIQRAMQMQTMSFEHSRDSEDHQRSLALYIRYQTTNERAFSKCLNDLLKLRSEATKRQIGFESQELKKQDLVRKQSIENRKQELHKLTVWLAEAKAEHQELLNLRLETPEIRDPNRINRILSRSQAA